MFYKYFVLLTSALFSKHAEVINDGPLRGSGQIKENVLRPHVPRSKGAPASPRAQL